MSNVSIYLLIGSEQTAVDKKLAQIKKFSNSTQLYGEENSADEISSTLFNSSLFGSTEQATIHGLSKNKIATDRLIEQLEKDPSVVNDTILIEPSLKKSSRLYKAVKAAGDVAEIYHFDSPKPYEMGRWVMEYIKGAGASISASDANFAASYLGSNTGVIASELTKLMSVTKEVTQESIETYCVPSPEATVFELLDAIGGGNTKRAQERAEILMQAKNDEARRIHIMIAWQLYNWTVTAQLFENADSSIASSAKISPYVVKKSRSQLGNSKHDALILSKKAASIVGEYELMLSRDFTDARQTVLLEIAELSELFRRS